MFFVDDSNIWIEAQKFAASGNSHVPKLTDSDRDPRLRIDIGKLINILRRDRNQGASYLYGSRPPPNDSVWSAFEKFKFKTKIYDRARGKEKEVDNSMATDLSSKATELFIGAKYDQSIKKQKAATTFVVITGDRDMLPPIQKVLEYEMRVELWAWRSGMSTEYFKLDADHTLLSVNLMDSIFDRISFTNFRSTRNKRIDPGQTVVICGFDCPDGDELRSSVLEQLMQLGRLFYITLSKTKMEMFVEFPRENHIETMVLKARDLFKDMLTVLSWPEYASNLKADLTAFVATSNMYAPLTNDDGQGSAEFTANEEHETTVPETRPSNETVPRAEQSDNQKTQGLDDPDENSGWSTVTRSDPGNEHRRRLQKTQQCKQGIRCERGGECGFRHTEEEHNHFRDHPGFVFKAWKTMPCTRANCRQGKRCSFAHTQEEAWCRQCRHEGHFFQDCRFKGSYSR